MNKKIAVLVTNLVQDDELSVPTNKLKEDGYEVTLINSNTDPIIGVMGRKFDIDAKIDNVHSGDFDALFLPGGFSPDQLRTDSRFIGFVKDFLEESKLVFAICHGPQFFIQSGLLKGRTVTGYESIIPDLYFAGAITQNKAVVIDGNLITSRNPDDLQEFVPAIERALKN